LSSVDADPNFRHRDIDSNYIVSRIALPLVLIPANHEQQNITAFHQNGISAELRNLLKRIEHVFITCRFVPNSLPRWL